MSIFLNGPCCESEDLGLFSDDVYVSLTCQVPIGIGQMSIDDLVRDQFLQKKITLSLLNLVPEILEHEFGLIFHQNVFLTDVKHFVSIFP